MVTVVYNIPNIAAWQQAFPAARRCVTSGRASAWDRKGRGALRPRALSRTAGATDQWLVAVRPIGQWSVAVDQSERAAGSTGGPRGAPEPQAGTERRPASDRVPSQFADLGEQDPRGRRGRRSGDSQANLARTRSATPSASPWARVLWARAIVGAACHGRWAPCPAPSPGPWLEPFMRHGFRCAKVPAGREKSLYIAAGRAPCCGMPHSRDNRPTML